MFPVPENFYFLFTFLPLYYLLSPFLGQVSNRFWELQICSLYLLIVFLLLPVSLGVFFITFWEKLGDRSSCLLNYFIYSHSSYLAHVSHLFIYHDCFFIAMFCIINAIFILVSLFIVIIQTLHSLFTTLIVLFCVSILSFISHGFLLFFFFLLLLLLF